MKFLILEKWWCFGVVGNKKNHQRIALRNHIYAQEEDSSQRFETR